jgi:Protein of unknown function (DUF3592)
MFEDLYDTISRLWSRRWPEAKGEVTAVAVERTGTSPRDRGHLRLAVAYKFSVNGDDAYTGEAFWSPAFRFSRAVLAARRKIRVGHAVLVRYRPDDPSVNTLDRRVWKRL